MFFQPRLVSPRSHRLLTALGWKWAGCHPRRKSGHIRGSLKDNDGLHNPLIRPYFLGWHWGGSTSSLLKRNTGATFQTLWHSDIIICSIQVPGIFMSWRKWNSPRKSSWVTYFIPHSQGPPTGHCTRFFPSKFASNFRIHRFCESLDRWKMVVWVTKIMYVLCRHVLSLKMSTCKFKKLSKFPSFGVFSFLFGSPIFHGVPWLSAIPTPMPVSHLGNPNEVQ